MVRLLILAFLAYLLYRFVRGWMQPSHRLKRSAGGGAIDEMVQDPQCKIYVPKREAYHKVIMGKEYLFCSKECAEAFEQGMRNQAH